MFVFLLCRGSKKILLILHCRHLTYHMSSYLKIFLPCNITVLCLVKPYAVLGSLELSHEIVQKKKELSHEVLQVLRVERWHFSDQQLLTKEFCHLPKLCQPIFCYPVFQKKIVIQHRLRKNQRQGPFSWPIILTDKVKKQTNPWSSRKRLMW